MKIMMPWVELWWEFIKICNNSKENFPTGKIGIVLWLYFKMESWKWMDLSLFHLLSLARIQKTWMKNKNRNLMTKKKDNRLSRFSTREISSLCWSRMRCRKFKNTTIKKMWMSQKMKTLMKKETKAKSRLKNRWQILNGFMKKLMIDFKKIIKNL